MPPNYRSGTDTDYQRWLASQGRRPSDDSIPRYGPYEPDPYEAYDGEDVRPDNVASYEAMHKPTNPNNNPSLNLDISQPTAISGMAVYYILAVVVLLVIRYAWRSRRQREPKELEPASKE
ncbi:uncharacterized protein APUU_31631S [Aspergillus puulaauensis]|uniref:Uncharacterized protein n=1 Tax=Aspergillus puulaauensis TaxID=1220207 RepID=A0A7R7XKY8_9EURO|nr:uncharacterized protein APUU_31631S [Aspergillus puulaauensis]BCS23406.1 hypothetical protein APUU_31631S [Aspergillus puulaauensis]